MHRSLRRAFFGSRLSLNICLVVLVATATLFLLSSNCLQHTPKLRSSSHVEALEAEIRRLKAELNLKQTSPQNGQETGAIVSNVVENHKLSECGAPTLLGYSECEEKIKWMKEMWRSDKCYSDWGVNGSVCSMYKYLSEVEKWCPPLQTSPNSETDSQIAATKETAVVRENMDELYRTIGDDYHYLWMKQRIERMEKRWLDAGKAFGSRFKTARSKKRVLLHISILADDSGWNLGVMAFKGGPLGELVQWSDLMASLHVIGHDVTISTTRGHLQSIFDGFLSDAGGNCPPRNVPFDVIYADIMGMKAMKQVTGAKFHLLECRLRPVDSFGSQPEFNNPTYARRNGFETQWGLWNLVPQQFNTMFPHTPDNTFLGFVIEQHSDVTSQNFTKSNIALVYGKNEAYWEGRGAYIDAIHDFDFEIHATVSGGNAHDHVPPYVINHGVLPGNELQALLRKTKIFVGLGHPCEGTGSLEAIANGAVFFNPKFVEGTALADQTFSGYMGKPTNRRPTSQHPYAEMFIGPPHVRTVDMENIDQIKQVVAQIVKSPNVEPYMPYEFTWLGMVERVAHQTELQNFCGRKTVAWPPLSAMQVTSSGQSETCSQACSSRGLICEPSYFPEVNNENAFKQFSVECGQTVVPTLVEENSAYPAYREGVCYLQSNSQIFSCAGRQRGAQRLCPCRDFIKGQVALCQDCLMP